VRSDGGKPLLRSEKSSYVRLLCVLIANADVPAGQRQGVTRLREPQIQDSASPRVPQGGAAGRARTPALRVARKAYGVKQLRDPQGPCTPRPQSPGRSPSGRGDREHLN
jgi:hypothetical protein